MPLLILAFVSATDHRLTVALSQDGRTWTAPTPVADVADYHHAPAAAAVCVFGATVCMAYRGRHNGTLNFTQSADGVTWTQGRPITGDDGATPRTSTLAPALAAIGDQLTLTYLNAANALQTAISLDGVDWLDNGTVACNLNPAIAPSLTDIGAPVARSE